MKKLLIFVLLCSLPSMAATALVQKKFSAPGTAGSTRAVTTLGIGTGNLVAVFGVFTSTTSSTTPTATGLTFAQVGADIVNVTASTKISLWYAKNTTSGATAVSCNTAASASFLDCYVLEFSGIDTVAPLRTNQSGTGNGTTLSTTALTVTVGDLIVAGGFGANITATNLTLGDTGDGNADAYTLSAGSTSITPTMTSTTGQWGMLSAAFIPTGAVATKNCTLTLMGAGPC